MRELIEAIVRGSAIGAGPAAVAVYGTARVWIRHRTSVALKAEDTKRLQAAITGTAQRDRAAVLAAYAAVEAARRSEPKSRLWRHHSSRRSNASGL